MSQPLYVTNSLQLAFLMPMGGTLHRAALRALDKLRDHGLPSTIANPPIAFRTLPVTIKSSILRIP